MTVPLLTFPIVENPRHLPPAADDIGTMFFKKAETIKRKEKHREQDGMHTSSFKV